MFGQSFEKSPQAPSSEKERMSKLKSARDNPALPLEERRRAAEEVVAFYKNREEASGSVADKIDRVQAEQERDDLEKDAGKAATQEDMDLDFTTSGALEGIEVQEVFDPIADDMAAIKEKIKNKSANDSGFDSHFDGDAFDSALRGTGEAQEADKIDAARRRLVA